MRNAVRQHQVNAIHLHGVWMAAPAIGARVARHFDIPYVTTTHGMLSPTRFRHRGYLSWLRKSVYWRLVAKPLFERARVVHAITTDEQDVLTALLPNQSIQVIPNFVDVKAIDQQRPRLESAPEQFMLFLGRIHPIKGVDRLLHAFANAKLDRQWKLVIAGLIEIPSYHAQLVGLAESLGLGDRITFIGPVYDEEKFSLLQRAWATVTPSTCEAIGIVNLESATCHTPVITTHGTGLTEWGCHGGTLVSQDTEELTRAIRESAQWDARERQDRGIAMRNWIEKRYALDIVGQQWVRLYQDMVD